MGRTVVSKAQRRTVGGVQPQRAKRRQRCSPIAASAVAAAALGVAGALSFAGTAGALAPSPGVTPIQDLNGVPNAISVEAPYIYVIPSPATDAPAADWAFQLNDNQSSPVSSVWRAGDIFRICVSGGRQDVAGGGWVDFASKPTVSVENPSFGGTVPTFSTSLSENPSDVSNDAGLTDCLNIAFLDSGDGASLTNPVILISNIAYNVGAGTPSGTIGTSGQYISSATDSTSSVTQSGQSTTSPAPTSPSSSGQSGAVPKPFSAGSVSLPTPRRV